MHYTVVHDTVHCIVHSVASYLPPPPPSPRCYQACRQQMLALWALLLALLEGRVVGFAVRRCCYELLRLLLHREELGCTLFASAEAGLLDT